MSQNKSFKDGKTGIERTIGFCHVEHLNKKTKFRNFKLRFRQTPAETTYAYAMKENQDGVFRRIINHSLTFTDLISVTIDFGRADRNPNDPPNRKVGRRLARMRMKFKPVEVNYFITLVEITAKKITVNLVSEDIPYDLQKFRYMVLVQDRSSGHVRLMNKKFDEY